MVTITADTISELAFVQEVIATGILNSRFKENGVNVTYKLNNGNKILTNKYKFIIGEKLPDGTINNILEVNDGKH